MAFWGMLSVVLVPCPGVRSQIPKDRSRDEEGRVPLPTRIIAFCRFDRWVHGVHGNPTGVLSGVSDLDP